MQILEVVTYSGRMIKVPKELPCPIAELAISNNDCVPALRARQVRVMPITLGLVCCDCAQHLIGALTVMVLN